MMFTGLFSNPVFLHHEELKYYEPALVNKIWLAYPDKIIPSDHLWNCQNVYSKMIPWVSIRPFIARDLQADCLSEAIT